jgi:inosine-uridine nucleoside N-ribohydrolase
MSFPILPEAVRVARLAPPRGQNRCVLDTDTYNEVDDQFALAYALFSPEAIRLEAVYAAPFHNRRSLGPEDGMEKSYAEILAVLRRAGRSADHFAFRGSDQWLPASDIPVDSPAARDLVARAHAEDSPLYVLTIGAPTNVASALLLDPSLVSRVVVVWLGGQPHAWPTAREFNLQQDLAASRVLFDSGVPLVQIPCTNVAEHLRVTIPELEAFLAGRNDLADYLCGAVRDYAEDPFAWSKVLWDISAVAWMVNPQWFDTALAPSPVLTSDYTYSCAFNRPLVRVAMHLRRDPIFRDVYTKLNA